MQFPVEEIKSSRKVTRPFTPFSLYKPQNIPKYLETDLRFLRKISNMALWQKKWAGEQHPCRYTPRDSGRSGLVSSKDWMLTFRTCCKASGYRNGGCQCQGRIHASNSTLPSGHSSSCSEVPINVWPQQEAAACQDSLLGAPCYSWERSSHLGGIVLEACTLWYCLDDLRKQSVSLQKAAN